MDWIILIVAGLFETAFAFCLEKMKGAKDKFGHRLWTMGFVVCLAASMWLLAVAVHTCPSARPIRYGRGSARWVPCCSVSCISAKGSLSPRIFFIATLIASIIGLKMV